MYHDEHGYQEKRQRLIDETSIRELKKGVTRPAAKIAEDLAELDAAYGFEPKGLRELTVTSPPPRGNSRFLDLHLPARFPDVQKDFEDFSYKIRGWARRNKVVTKGFGYSSLLGFTVGVLSFTGSIYFSIKDNNEVFHQASESAESHMAMICEQNPLEITCQKIIPLEQISGNKDIELNHKITSEKSTLKSMLTRSYMDQLNQQIDEKEQGSLRHFIKARGIGVSFLATFFALFPSITEHSAG